MTRVHVYLSHDPKVHSHRRHSGRLWGVAGVDTETYSATIKGLTKWEAEVVVKALNGENTAAIARLQAVALKLDGVGTLLEKMLTANTSMLSVLKRVEKCVEGPLRDEVRANIERYGE